tara:strand:+ start:6511 stop:6906 length:396 start_codon:yes stop_codon:yes gene_type:complete
MPQTLCFFTSKPNCHQFASEFIQEILICREGLQPLVHPKIATPAQNRALNKSRSRTIHEPNALWLDEIRSTRRRLCLFGWNAAGIGLPMQALLVKNRLVCRCGRVRAGVLLRDQLLGTLPIMSLRVPASFT